MLLKNSNLSRLNYQLVRTFIKQKYKDNKGQETNKTFDFTGINGTLVYTVPFTSVIINIQHNS